MNYLRFLQKEAGTMTSRLLTAAGLCGILNGVLILLVISATGMNYRSPEQSQLLLLFVE